MINVIKTPILYFIMISFMKNKNMIGKQKKSYYIYKKVIF